MRIHQNVRGDVAKRRGLCARLWQGLPVALIISALLLVAGVFGLGLAIQNSVVAPPILGLRYSGIGIAVYRTHYPDCPPYTQCPPQSVAPLQEYYVIWSIYKPSTADHPYGRTAHCLLVVPLRR